MCRNALLCASIVVVITLAASPAKGDDTPMPAQMTSCAVLPATVDRRNDPAEKIRVSFMITGDVPADLVRFTAAGPAGGFREFETRGNFTKEVMISDRELHSKTPTTHSLPRGVECRLTYIHFVNGTSWSYAGEER
jgi:hypothetical protein